MGTGLRALARRVPGPWRPPRGSWAVCAMVAEPPELLCAFAAHYLSLGAREVHLFLDDPEQPGVDLLKALPHVRLTLCTDQYWQRLAGQRPVNQVMRQIINANRAYDRCRADWFFFCDADEFLTAEAPVAQLLRAVPETVLQCRVPMAERVLCSQEGQAHLFDGVFRVPLPENPDALRAAYGDLADMTTHGLTGHLAGKTFTRARRSDLRIRLHLSVPANPEEEARLRQAGALRPGPDLAGSRLVHFDGMTPLHWHLKMLRFYLENPPKVQAGGKVVFAKRTPARSRQVNAVYERAGDPAALRRLRRLIELDPDARAILERAGGLLPAKIDPRRSVRHYLKQDLPFDVATFDARLRARHGPLIAEYGLDDAAPGGG